jgi:hypothetical protein
MQKVISQRGTEPGRHHVGTPGDIISECLGGFVGIRTLQPQTNASAFWIIFLLVLRRADHLMIRFELGASMARHHIPQIRPCLLSF